MVKGLVRPPNKLDLPLLEEVVPLVVVPQVENESKR
jgi:hypothetical protein